MKIPDFETESRLQKQGFSIIAGVDEVGRGAWAGPVVAGAIIIPSIFHSHLESPIYRHPESPTGEGSRLARDFSKLPRNDLLFSIRDSKTLSKKQRDQIDSYIQENVIWAIGECTNQEIDAIGIAEATQLAMKRAVQALSTQPDMLLIDGREVIDLSIKQQSIIDGDASVLSIAAASIIAKVHRDQLMADYDSTYPGYGFSQHVGYGTAFHRQALDNHGSSPIHRLTYKPLVTLELRA